MATRNILVVDDEPEIARLVADILGDENYQADTAANGRIAIEKCSRNEYDLVILDMRMPVLDGWGFARELAHSGKKIPIIVMTAAVSAARWAAEINAEGYISKPFTIDTILDTVTSVYDKHVLPAPAA